MPKAVEDCVKKISGVNKKTGKPYTQSEKWAICTAAHKNKKSSVDDIVNEEDISLAEEKFDSKMEACQQRMMKSGKAKNTNDAHQLCMKELSKAGYNLDRLEFFVDLELLYKNL